MKVETKRLPKSIIEFVIEEDTKNIAKERKSVIEDLKKNAEVKWFRKWQVPEDILIKKFWEEYINERVIWKAIDKLYQEALKKEKFVPVSQAQVEEIISQDPLKFKVTVEIFPEVTLKDGYKKVKLKKEIVEISDKEVDDALEDIQTRFTTYKNAEENAKVENWDRVTIDTDWYDLEWKLLENTSMKDYPLVIWSKMMVPWFEDWIIGKKSWETFEMPITFPKDYHNADFAWKQTNFKVTVKNIEKSVRPEFTPEFIKDLRWKDLDLAWFRELIREELKENKESQIRAEEESQLIDELLKHCEVDIWDKLLNHQIEMMYDDMKARFADQWYKMADYLESIKMDEESYRWVHLKPVATKRLQWELILSKILMEEKIKVSDEEMQTEVDKILWRYSSKDAVEKLKNIYVPWNKYFEELRQRMSYRKLIDQFFE